MTKSIYLINPAADFPTYFTSEVVAGWGFAPAVCLADLAIPTIAALVPGDFAVELCDENLTPVDFDNPAELVALTGKVSQWERVKAIAAEFRRRGKTVILGGPHASLCPAAAVEHCDILVRGEIEEIAADLFSDLRARRWKEEYVGTRPSLERTPRPRWDLYPNDRALTATVQTSRGCPFECEFCDVIQYLGRRQRHKPIAAVLGELDELYRLGYRSVLLADDNFTAVRRRAKELLHALGRWNARQRDGEVTFSTQLSIDAARDDELLRLCAQAGLTQAFIGIETPNEASLRETRKRQNIGVDLAEQVGRFFDHGIGVIAGMIVGFDHDDLDIFERQYEFASSTEIPIFTLGALVAPAATPLHERMRSQGRLTTNGAEIAAAPWATNLVPERMSQDELLRGIQWLANALYEPRAFAARVLRLVERLGERGNRQQRGADGYGLRSARSVERDALAIIKKLSSLGPEESKMMWTIFGAVSRKPHTLGIVASTLLQYAQIRFMYERGELWSQAPAERTA